MQTDLVDIAIVELIDRLVSNISFRVSPAHIPHNLIVQGTARKMKLSKICADYRHKIGASLDS